jgi:hypothetical protein
MSIFLTKNKTNNLSTEEFMNIILNKSEQFIPIVKKPIRISDDEISIPTIKNYDDIVKYNYNVPQLKSIAKHYKLKIGGNKNQLVNRIFSFLYLSSYLIKIQKIVRGVIQRTFNMLHGPAYMNRKLCTNNADFVTMEPLEDIKYNQFISFKDVDGFIYGFDIVSIYNLFSKSGSEIKNPYNRAIIPAYVLKNIKTLLQLSKILKQKLCLQNEYDNLVFSLEKTIELRALSLFQNIDALGNYSDPQWFLSLPRVKIIRFVRELGDIWNYRAQLSTETKINICPPMGDPFRNLSLAYLHTETNMSNVQKAVLEVLEKIVNTGVNVDSKSLGSYYVLGALTLVNESTATALPWLYQSVSYF